MFIILLLLLTPLLGAAITAICFREKIRRVVILLFSVALCAASVCLMITSFHHLIQYFKADAEWINRLFQYIECAIGAYIIYIAVRNRRPLIVILAAAQTILMFWFEHKHLHEFEITNNIFIDKLSIIMAVIIGVIGSLICIYSVGYMRQFHEHFQKTLPDRSRFLAVVLFVFLSAMFGVVFFNNLIWLYFVWEITTLCSFLLIGYKQTEESINNSFKALEYNLIGGLAFVIGIVILFNKTGILELDKMMHADKTHLLLPVAFLSLAALTKAAQMPFSSWLVGAMVAPTPVSALLHSSTMVKAGVYLILRFSAILQGTSVGFAISLIGAITFFVGSFIAISQRDAKKVLAYSTISNLGLIVMCAGVGTYEALWAGVLLIIFHAIAKCLLFLCVGIVEHKLHSRDIEDMTGLIIKMPKLSIMLQIGMAGMFLAPFGMLIGKWAVLKAMVDYNPMLAIFVIFGSSATLFYWVKWMGKFLIVSDQQEHIESGIDWTQWSAITLISVFTAGVCGLFPILSSMFVEPYVIEIYGKTVLMGPGNVIIMLVMLGIVILFPLSFINYGKNVKVVDAYLAGANTGDGTEFMSALQKPCQMQMSNYYLGKYFGEKLLSTFGVLISIVLIIVMFILTLR
jgi:ech hydrogenase subunit A